MIQILLWVLFGMLGGWIGYLASRQTYTDTSTPHLLLGAITSLLVGMLTRNIGIDTQQVAVNPYSMLMALIISTICVMGYGLLRNTTRNDI